MPRAPVSRRLLARAPGADPGRRRLRRHVATDPPADYFRLALTSLSISASGLFPVMLAAVWWRRANRFGALAGMLAGFAVALLPRRRRHPRSRPCSRWLEPVGLVEHGWPIGQGPSASERAALVAVPVGPAGRIVLVSLVTPSAGRRPARLRCCAAVAARHGRPRRRRLGFSQRSASISAAAPIMSRLRASAPRRCFGVEPPMLDVPVLVDMRGIPRRLHCRSHRPRTPAPAAPSR